MIGCEVVLVIRSRRFMHMEVVEISCLRRKHELVIVMPNLNQISVTGGNDFILRVIRTTDATPDIDAFMVNGPCA